MSLAEAHGRNSANWNVNKEEYILAPNQKRPYITTRTTPGFLIVLFLYLLESDPQNVESFARGNISPLLNLILFIIGYCSRE